MTLNNNLIEKRKLMVKIAFDYADQDSKKNPEHPFLISLKTLMELSDTSDKLKMVITDDIIFKVFKIEPADLTDRSILYDIAEHPEEHVLLMKIALQNKVPFDGHIISIVDHACIHNNVAVAAHIFRTYYDSIITTGKHACSPDTVLEACNQTNYDRTKKWYKKNVLPALEIPIDKEQDVIYD